VLLDAVIHLQRRDSRGAAEAVEWIEGEPYGRSFLPKHICESLGLERTRTRARALRGTTDRGRRVSARAGGTKAHGASEIDRFVNGRRRRAVAAVGWTRLDRRRISLVSGDSTRHAGWRGAHLRRSDAES